VAAAVAAAVAVPVGVQAEATVYARINNALVFEDTGDSTTSMETVGSRFGIKGSSDLGNGLVAHGQYEFATTTEKEKDAIVDIRVATAGISGGFGRFDVGNQWSAYYNTTGVHMDPTYTTGPISGATPYRGSNTIKYSNSVGPLSLEADLRLNDGKDKAPNAEGLRGDGGGVGVSIDATPNLSFAAAFDVDDQTNEMTKNDDGPTTIGDDHSRAGLSAKLSLGQFWGSLAWASHEAEDMKGKTKADKEFVAAYVGADFTDQISGWVGYSQADVDTLKGAAVKEGEGKEPNRVMAGLYYNMGGGLRFWYEGYSEDHDNDKVADATTETVKHYVGIRYDF